MMAPPGLSRLAAPSCDGAVLNRRRHHDRCSTQRHASPPSAHGASSQPVLSTVRRAPWKRTGLLSLRGLPRRRASLRHLAYAAPVAWRAMVVRVLVADDHALVREGTRELLDREPDIDVVGEAADGHEAVRLVGELQPDVAILDIGMPYMNGVEATRLIKQRHPQVKVLVLTVHADDAYIFSVLDAGAAGYLLKDVRSDEVVAAVRAIQSGESVLHPAITGRVLRYFRGTRMRPTFSCDSTSPATASSWRSAMTDRASRRGRRHRRRATGVSASVACVSAPHC